MHIKLDTYKGQGSPGVFGRDTVNQHVSLRRDNGRVDKPKEEETANKRTNSVIRSIGIFALRCVS